MRAESIPVQHADLQHALPRQSAQHALAFAYASAVALVQGLRAPREARAFVTRAGAVAAYVTRRTDWVGEGRMEKGEGRRAQERGGHAHRAFAADPARLQRALGYLCPEDLCAVQLHNNVSAVGSARAVSPARSLCPGACPNIDNAEK